MALSLSRNSLNREAKLITALFGYLISVCVVIALYPPQPSGGYFFVGLAIGSLFAFTILPALWTTFGPGHRIVRWPLACLLLIALPQAIYPSARSETISLLLGQMAIVVLLLLVVMLLRFLLGIRLLRLTESSAMQPSVAVKQYGIRHLMILTTAIAVLLSVGRMIMPFLSRLPAAHDLPVWVFLAFSSCVICMPILFSLLTLRNSFLPTLVLLGLSVLVTWNEATLLASLKLRGPDFYHFAWINFFTILPIFFVAVGLRKCGYRLIGRYNDAVAETAETSQAVR